MRIVMVQPKGRASRILKGLTTEGDAMRISARAVKAFLAGGVLAMLPMMTFAQHYTQENLVSDIAQPDNADGTAVTIDPNLKNAWGLARGAASAWWVNNAGTGTSTLYNGAGAITPLVVTVPNAAGVKGPSSPTGIIFNGTSDFALATNNPAAFIFATKNGTISGWGPPFTPITPNSAGVGQSLAVNKVEESKSGAVFMGLTWVEMGGDHFL